MPKTECVAGLLKNSLIISAVVFMMIGSLPLPYLQAQGVLEEQEAVAWKNDETRYEDPAGLFSVPIPTNWTVEQAEGYGILTSPDENLTVYVMAVEAESVEEGVRTAWAVIDPTFDLEPVQVIQEPVTRGEDEAVTIIYDSGDENEVVIGGGWLYEGIAYIEIFRGDVTTFLKYVAEVQLINNGYDIYALKVIDELPVDGRRNLVIDLGEGLETDAQLTFPADSEGPFPGVLLIHGSGNTDMDEYLPPLITGTGEPARPFLQIAEYLSERGFAVLRYNKRGVGLGGTVLDLDTFLNKTYGELQADAVRALEVLKQQPEVDVSDITLIGHSEGTIIAPRIAIGDPSIKKTVLVSSAAWNLHDILYYQLVDRRVLYLEEVVDTNDDGFLSIGEVNATRGTPLVYLSPMPPESLLNSEMNFSEWAIFPGFGTIDVNGDGFISIHEVLEPLLIQVFEFATTFTYHEKGGVTLELLAQNPLDNPWMEEHFALESTLTLIGNVTASILILQGEDDIQTPVEQAFLLEQRLTEIGHPDHTLVTYPGLGHTLYPLPSPWIQPLGPIEKYVLADLAAWLKDPARTVRYLKAEIQTASKTIVDLQNQLMNVNSELRLRTSELDSAKNKIRDLDETLDTADQMIGELNIQLASETQRFIQELETSRNEAKDIETKLTAYIGKANREINDMKSQINDLQSKSSSLENTITKLTEQNVELNTTLDMALTIAYIAIGAAVIAFIWTAAQALRRRSIYES